MEKTFGGKVVLITGAGAGIGEATAQKMAAAGAKVVVNSISGSGQLVAQKLVLQQRDAAFFRADISKEEEVEKLVAFTLARYGALHVVVTNAGVVPSGNVEETTLEQWNHTMAVNVTGAYLVSKHCLPFLRQTAGTIVNVSSVAAIKGTQNRAAYSASKGALLSLSKAMATDYFKENVRVNCVCPGT
ncbi:MAG: SDR family NAD(P)-dependent oxidoreductase, partial [Oscillospiraceae bacterium]